MSGWDTAERTREPRAAALARIATARLEARIPDLVGVLAGDGIPVIVLKGPATRQRLYGPDECRPAGDIDLLVPPRAFRQAGEVLSGRGFVRTVRDGHSDTWRRSDVEVDLHLALPYATLAPTKAFRVLAGHVTSLDVAGRPVPVLDTPSHAVHLAMHAAQNRFRPDRRPTEDWRRARAALSAAQAVEAASIARELGATDTWENASAALLHPERVAALAAQLPMRKPEHSFGALVRFARSAIPIRLRARSAVRFVRYHLSDQALASWRRCEGLPPRRRGSCGYYRAWASRLGIAFARALGRAVGW